MKKTILSLAVLFATTFSFSALAQAPAADAAACAAEKTECCKKDAGLFEGITLTADQQAKLDALKTQCAKDKKDAKEADKARKEAKKESRDAQRKERLAQIKTILTPDQYVIFLENAFVKQGAPKGQFDRVKGAKKGDVKGGMKARDGKKVATEKRGKAPRAEKAAPADKK